MPQLGFEQAVAEQTMNECALDVLAAGEVTKIFAELGPAPLDGFHCCRVGISWDLPPNMASVLFSAT
jgi:hypothetical protein